MLVSPRPHAPISRQYDIIFNCFSEQPAITVNRWDNTERIDAVACERRVLGYTDELMLVHSSLEEGAVGEPHSHEETTQASFVYEGSLELTGEFSTVIEARDSYVIPPGTEHGVRVLEPCRVIDAFAPPLERYRPE